MTTPSTERRGAGNSAWRLAPVAYLKGGRKRVRIVGLAALVAVFATAIGVLTVPRLLHSEKSNAEITPTRNATPRVPVAQAVASPAENERVLPGNSFPLLETG